MSRDAKRSYRTRRACLSPFRPLGPFRPLRPFIPKGRACKMLTQSDQPDRSPIDLDRCQTIDLQHQSTSDRFLNSCLAHASSPTSPSRKVVSHAGSPRRHVFRRMSTFPSQVPAIINSNDLISRILPQLPHAPRLTRTEGTFSTAVFCTVPRNRIFFRRSACPDIHPSSSSQHFHSLSPLRTLRPLRYPFLLPSPHRHVAKSPRRTLIKPPWYRAFLHCTAKPNIFPLRFPHRPLVFISVHSWFLPLAP